MRFAAADGGEQRRGERRDRLPGREPAPAPLRPRASCSRGPAPGRAGNVLHGRARAARRAPPRAARPAPGRARPRPPPAVAIPAGGRALALAGGRPIWTQSGARRRLPDRRAPSQVSSASTSSCATTSPRVGSGRSCRSCTSCAGSRSRDTEQVPADARVLRDRRSERAPPVLRARALRRARPRRARVRLSRLRGDDPARPAAAGAGRGSRVPGVRWRSSRCRCTATTMCNSELERRPRRGRGRADDPGRRGPDRPVRGPRRRSASTG